MAPKVWSRVGKNLTHNPSCTESTSCKANVTVILWTVCWCFACVYFAIDSFDLVFWQTATGTVTNEGAYTVHSKSGQHTMYKPEVSFTITNGDDASSQTYSFRSKSATANKIAVGTEVEVMYPQSDPSAGQLRELVLKDRQATGWFVVLSVAIWWCILRCLYKQAEAQIEFEEQMYPDQVATAGDNKNTELGVYNRELT